MPMKTLIILSTDAFRNTIDTRNVIIHKTLRIIVVSFDIEDLRFRSHTLFERFLVRELTSSDYNSVHIRYIVTNRRYNIIFYTNVNLYTNCTWAIDRFPRRKKRLTGLETFFFFFPPITIVIFCKLLLFKSNQTHMNTV